MAKYLSQEWLDLQKELAQALPQRAGATARMQVIVTGAPDGDVRYHSVIEDGRVRENSLGDDDRAEVTLTTGYADSVKVVMGELDANAAFMQGRTKVAGDMGKVMHFMPLTQSPEYRSIQAELAEKTDF